MRCILLQVIVFLLVCRDVLMVDGFLGDWQLFGGGDGGAYQSRISVTGRVFATMLGYPQRCERRGASHSCTLSLACWLTGGTSQSGCGASPWIVACCIIKAKHTPGHDKDTVLLENREDAYHNMEGSNDLQLLGGKYGKRKKEFDEANCGVSVSRLLSKRIIGGDEAQFGQFPWQAHLKIAAYQCGGVLVSRRFVATAAHCIIAAKMTDIKIYLGELDTQDTGKVLELAPAELHRIKRRIIHPKFHYRTTQPDRYDLALLEMLTEAGRVYHIVPICLPQKDILLTGRDAVVAGWGKVIPSSDLKGTNVLRSTSVPILDIKDCAKWHKIKQIKVELHREMVCAGYEDGRQDACLGDSGGPLIVRDHGRWVLVGITSAGFGCGEAHQPGIYHSVPTTVDWIRSVIYT